MHAWPSKQPAFRVALNSSNLGFIRQNISRKHPESQVLALNCCLYEIKISHKNSKLQNNVLNRWQRCPRSTILSTSTLSAESPRAMEQANHDGHGIKRNFVGSVTLC